MYSSSGCNYTDNISVQFKVHWPLESDDPYRSQINPQDYYIQVATSSVSFFFSLLGVILDIIFICRIKTNFMVRLFVYLMVATTMELGAACPRSIFMIHVIHQSCTSINRQLVDLFFIIAVYCLWVQAVTVCSIDVTLLTKIYKYTCGATSSTTTQCHAVASCWRNRNLKCMEALFLTVLFGLPVVITIIVLTSIIESSSSIWSISNSASSLHLIAAIPVLFNLLCNIGLIVVLPVWFFWLRRRQVARVRTRAVLKETGLFVLLLFSTPFVWLFLNFWNSYLDSEIYSTAILSVFLGVLPYGLLVYMWLSFRSSARRVRIVQNENRDLRIPPRTTGLETAPQSTRVSLPTDTADHAPNFLSPSGDETTEVTPLLN